MMYDPRHTTGVSPVHKDVKHPLVYDPRSSANRSQLHRKHGRGRSFVALGTWLVFLLVALAGAMWWLFSMLADRAA